MTYDAVAEKVALVRERAGDRIDDIELNIRVFYVSVTDDRAGLAGVASTIGVDPELVDVAVRSRRQHRGDRRRPRAPPRRARLSATWSSAPTTSSPFAPVVAALAGT